MEASAWAQQKAQEMQAVKTAEEVRAALNLERQRIRTSNFPDLTRAVLTSFQEHCGEYNKVRSKNERSVEFSAIGPSLYMLRRDAGWSEMNIRINLSACTINISANRCSFRYDLTYRPEALADGTAVLSCSNGQLVTPENVAQKAIDAFLDGREMAERL